MQSVAMPNTAQQLCPGQVTWLTSNMLEFFESSPSDVQTNLRAFLSTGDPELLTINEDNFHFYFHFALKWNHSSLLQVCLMFSINKGSTMLPETLVCDCPVSLQRILQKQYNCQTFVCFEKSNSRMTMPEYLVLFTCRKLTSTLNQLSVLDLRTIHVYSGPVRKGKDMGEGYAVCSLHTDRAPYVVISGGCGKSTGKLHRYDVVRDKWDMKIDLKYKRSRHVMCSAGGHIYLIGGQENSTVEVCDLKSRNCVNIGILPVGVHNMSHILSGDRIYLFGGETKHGSVSAVQYIDVIKKKISRLKDLPCECSGGHAIAHNNKIYIATHQGHMIRFDPITGDSELCSHPPCSRKYFTMFAKDDSIFLIGGVRNDGNKDDSCATCQYVPDHDRWVKATISTGLCLFMLIVGYSILKRVQSSRS